MKLKYGQIMEKILKARAGSHIYKGVEMPINAKLFTIKSGQECYLSGSSYENGKWLARVFVFELDKLIQVDYDKIKKYIE